MIIEVLTSRSKYKSPLIKKQRALSLALWALCSDDSFTTGRVTCSHLKGSTVCTESRSGRSTAKSPLASEATAYRLTQASHTTILTRCRCCLIPHAECRRGTTRLRCSRSAKCVWKAWCGRECGGRSKCRRGRSTGSWSRRTKSGRSRGCWGRYAESRRRPDRRSKPESTRGRGRGRRSRAHRSRILPKQWWCWIRSRRRGSRRCTKLVRTRRGSGRCNASGNRPKLNLGRRSGSRARATKRGRCEWCWRRAKGRRRRPNCT